MRIILIHPRNDNIPSPPLGLLYLASILEKNDHKVIVTDPDIKVSDTEIAKKVLNYSPDLVMFTSTTPQIIRGFNIAKEIKKHSSTPILFGGLHATLLIKEVLKNDFVDFVIFGEGEETIHEFVKHFKDKKSFSKIKGLAYKINGKIKINSSRDLIPNLDVIPFPAWNLLESKWYLTPPRIKGTWAKSTATMITSRGCPYRCIWCSSHLMFGRKVRRRSVRNVIKEIIYLKKNFDIDSVSFSDDTFTVNPKWVMRFCKELKVLKFKDFKWKCNARVDTVSYSLLKAMKDAGCVELGFGVESGSPRILKILKKGIKLKMTVDAFSLAKKVGLKSFAYLIIGTPGETKEDILLTLKLVKKIRPDHSEVSFATPYPSTELYKMAEKNGTLNKSISFDRWLLNRQTDSPIMCSGFSEKELIKYRSLIHNRTIFNTYLTLVKDPRFMLNCIYIMFKGKSGFINGLRRFTKTGKIDQIPVEVLAAYRNKMKENFAKKFY